MPTAVKSVDDDVTQKWKGTDVENHEDVNITQIRSKARIRGKAIAWSSRKAFNDTRRWTHARATNIERYKIRNSEGFRVTLVSAALRETPIR